MSTSPRVAESADAVASRRLLLIDDDVELCNLVTSYLGREGIAVDLAHDGPSGVEAALAGTHDAIVLDVMLPRLGGFEVLQRIRERKRTPILMLTARGDPVDRIVGLEMGADDYISKPFDPRELVARIRAVLRRAETRAAEAPAAASAPDQLEVGGLVANLGAREARFHSRVLKLTPVEFDMLVELMRSAGRLLTRDQLARAALGRPIGEDDRTVDTHIGNLRRKMGKSDDGRIVIRTVRSAGFLLPRDGDGDAS